MPCTTVPAGIVTVGSWTKLTYAGYDDWTLPTIKQFYSFIDFSTAITNEVGQTDYAYYWSSTTHSNWTNQAG